jgi:hypothetical protein
VALEASLLDERATSSLREQFIAVLRQPLPNISGAAELILNVAPHDRARRWTLPYGKSNR